MEFVTDQPSFKKKVPDTPLIGGIVVLKRGAPTPKTIRRRGIIRGGVRPKWAQLFVLFRRRRHTLK